MDKSEVIETLKNYAAKYHELEARGPVAKHVPTYREVTYTKTVLASMLELELRDIQKIMDSIEDEYFEIDNRNWAKITREQAAKIVQKAGVVSIPNQRLNSSDEYDTPVVIINQTKGGVGKTTTAIHLATEGALDVLRDQRVLLVDGDPQGSIIHQLSSTDSDAIFESLYNHISEHADLTREQRLTPENQAAFREYLLNEVITETHLDNLKVLPAVVTDTQIGLVITQKIISGGGIDDAMTLYNDLVIQPLKAVFDLIIIDTSPSPDLIVANLYYAANHVMFVTTGRKQDYRALISHHTYIAMMIEDLMPSDFNGYHSVKTLLTKHMKVAQNNPTSKMIQKNAAKIQSVNDVYVQSIYENPNYEKASDKKLPVQLLDANRSRAFQQSLDELRALYQEFRATIDTHLWK